MLPLGGLFIGTELTPLCPNLRAGMTRGGGAMSVYFRLTGFWYQTLTLWGSLGNPGLENYLFVCEFTQVPSSLPAYQAVVIQQLSIG